MSKETDRLKIDILGIKELKLWHDGTDWYWAYNLTDLEERIEEHTGDTYLSSCGEHVKDRFALWEPLSGVFTLITGDSYNDDVPDPMPAGAIKFRERSAPNVIAAVTASIDAWRDVATAGFFASLEY